MNAKELRLGNYVRFKNEYHDFCDKISCVQTHCVLLEAFSGTPKIEEVYHIILTKELLIEFGFEEKENCFIIENWWRLYEYSDGWWLDDHNGGFVNDYPIKYVHQLQNFFFDVYQKELEKNHDTSNK